MRVTSWITSWVTIRGLRVLLVAGAAVLLMLLAGFLGVAHFRAHRLLRELPRRLGADIEKETNGFTYSQASQGRTVFTLHAATATEHRDGRVLLHDVGIVLYGREQTRADRIYGKEFEYDQKAGVVRAMGEVHLDLGAPAPADAAGRVAYAAGEEPGARHEVKDPELVHVKTSGLVYVQALGVASTAEEVEFAYRGIAGRSHGAAYNANTGVTTLEQAVEISGVRDGRPMLLRATHAAMTKATGEMTLRGAQYVVVGQRSGREASAAGLLRVKLRPDGTVERADGSEGVKLESERGTVEAPRGEMEMNAAGRPRTARLAGGVRFAADGPEAQTAGQAGEATAEFDDRGQVRAIAMVGEVGLRERVQRKDEVAAGERELDAARVSLTLAAVSAMGGGAGAGRGLEQAVAEGGARLRLREPGRAGRPEQRSEMRGDRLVAHFEASGHGTQVTAVEGAGHTGLDRRLADGTEDRSSADALAVRFVTAALLGRGGGGGSARGDGALSAESRAAPGGPGAPGGIAAAQIGSVVERGSVVLRHEGTTRAGERQVVDGSAREAQYDGGLEHLVLVGEASAAESGSRVRADRIELERGSGDTRALGRVQVSYLRPGAGEARGAGAGGAEAVHVVAGRAEFSRETGVATFRGAEDGDGSAGAARMWQGGSQIEAPVIVLRQRDGELEARGAAGTQEVRTVLSEAAGVGRAEGKGGGERTAAGGPARAAAGGGAARITSGRLVYSDPRRTAEFREGVLLEDANGSVRSREATATLGAVAGTGGAAQREATRATGGRAGAWQSNGPLLPVGGLERVVAKGEVVLRQPGREAVGEELIYMAADGLFTLTGTPATPPRVTDAANGTVAGAAIRFHSGDNSVVVSGDVAGGHGGRVHTETKVKTD